MYNGIVVPGVLHGRRALGMRDKCGVEKEGGCF